MPVRSFQHAFSAGELSPDLDGRADVTRYYAGLKACVNYVPRPTGGVSRRHGLRFVNAVKDHTRKVRLEKFEFNVEQAYVLEMGHLYIRFYRQGIRLEDPPGTPVEVASPYQESELFAIQTAQSADTMWIVHPSHAPRRLLRFSDTEWSLQVIPFDPPPSVEAPDIQAIGLTLSAVSGTSVTVTAGAGFFLDGDVGRHLSLVPGQASAARGVLTALGTAAPSTTATMNILSEFPSTTILANTWQLDGPIATGLQVASPGLRSTVIKATLIRKGITAPELIANGNFSGLTSWTDHSGISLASGTHTGGNNSSDLQDTTKHFPALGIGVGYRAINNTDGSNANITLVRPGGNALAMTLTGGSDNDWDTGDTYNIYGNGGVVATNGGAQLSGGPGGVGWIEQGIATVNGQTYWLRFNVHEGPLSCQIGSTSRGSELFAEATFEIGLDHDVVFTAVSTTSYIQFRNNQPTMSRVSGVRCQNVSASGFRTADIGKFLKVHNGVLEILGLDNAFSANVLVRSETDSADEAVVGAWTLEVPAWSDSRGWPRAISFHQQRLGFAGTASDPLTVWQSETGLYDRFAASVLADSSLAHEFTANQMNVILWMEAFRDLLVGTATGEHLLKGVNGPLTPTNAEQLPQTTVGSHPLKPIRQDNALILLRRGGRQLTELIFDETGATSRGRDLTLYAEHITEGGLGQMALQTKPVPVLWSVRSDGTLIGLTYEQIEEVGGWHRQTTDGVIESVCVVPINSPTNQYTEEVFIAVRRTINGATVRYIEQFDPSLMVDSGLSYSGAETTTLSGLTHLVGKTVKVIDKSTTYRAILLDRVVNSSGEITLEKSVTAADVGLPYTSTIQTMRPELPLRDGTLQGRKKRWMRIMARVLDSVGLTINGQFADFRYVADLMDEGVPPRDRDVEVTNLGWDTDGHITIEQPDPLPSTILAIVGELEYEDR